MAASEHSSEILAKERPVANRPTLRKFSILPNKKTRLIWAGN